MVSILLVVNVVLRVLGLVVGVLCAVVGTAATIPVLVDYAEAMKFRPTTAEWSVWSWASSGPDNVRVDYIPGERRARVSARLFAMSDCPERVRVESSLDWGSSATFCSLEGGGGVGWIWLTIDAPADFDDGLATALAASYRSSWVYEGKEQRIVDGEFVDKPRRDDRRPISFFAFVRQWWSRTLY